MRILSSVFALSLISPVAFGDDDDIRLEDCPAAVRATIERHLGSGRLDEIEVYQSNGRALFVAEIDLAGGEDLKVHVADDGTLVKTREDVTPDALPAPVRAALAPLLVDGAYIDDADKEVTGSVVTFDVEIERRGAKDLHVVLSATGAIVRQSEGRK